MLSRSARSALILSLVACAAERGQKGGLVPLIVTSAQLDAAQAGRRLALVVGINQFEDSRWRALRYASKDGADLAAALGDVPNGGFEVDRVGADGRISRAEVLAGLAMLKERNALAEDLVVVYFSTHGTLARDVHGRLQRYLVLSDTRLDDVRDTGLSLEDLETAMDSLASRKKVLILATCHSGTGKSLLPPEVLRELEGTKAPFFAAPLEEKSRASIVLAACDWGETAREDEGLANDIYTHFLVEALLKPADRNGDGAVTATEAHDYARRKTFDFTQGQQRPSARIQEVGADPVVLRGRVERAGQPEFFGYESALDGLSVRIDGDDPVPLPGALAVPAGSHRVQVAKGDGVSVYEGELKVDLGQRIDLGDLVSHPETPTSVALAAGYQGFLDRSQASSLVGPGPAFSLSVARDDLVARHLGIQGDLEVTGGNRSVLVEGTTLPYFFTGIELGLAVPYQFRWGPWGAEVGPRVGAVLDDLSFSLPAYHRHQDYLVVSPSLTGKLTFRVTERWFGFFRVDGSAEAVVIDNRATWLGFASTWAGVGFRP
jgi:hypothetical protein